MKIRFIDSIDESWFLKQNLQQHSKHIAEYKNDYRFRNVDFSNPKDVLQKYNELGNWLSNVKVESPFSSARFVGYIDKNGRTVKYDRKNFDYIVFTKDSSITLHKKSNKQFEKIVRRDFNKEIDN